MSRDGHEAIGHGSSVSVYERLLGLVGLSSTIAFEGSRFDIGPHRFFTKNDEVHHLFNGLLSDELVPVRRQPPILNDGIFFDYPLTPLNAMFGIGVIRGLAIAGSYAIACMRYSMRTTLSRHLKT